MEMHFAVVVEGKESSFALKWGCLFQKAKEKKTEQNLNVKKKEKKLEKGCRKEIFSKDILTCGQTGWDYI